MTILSSVPDSIEWETQKKANIIFEYYPQIHHTVRYILNLEALRCADLAYEWRIPLSCRHLFIGPSVHDKICPADKKKVCLRGSDATCSAKLKAAAAGNDYGSCRSADDPPQLSPHNCLSASYPFLTPQQQQGCGCRL